MMYTEDHPLTAGMETESVAFFSRGRAFEIIKDTVDVSQKQEKSEAKDKEKKTQKPKPKPRYVKIQPKIVAKFAEDNILLSGWLKGDDLLRDKASIMEVPFGQGRIILFGFNIQNRNQSHVTFKLLFNALYR